MYPFGGLPENLAAFCRVLSTEYGRRVGSRELHDAARALRVTRLDDEHAVRNALRTVLSSSLDDARVFDRVFERFFHPDSARTAGTRPMAARRLWESDASARTRHAARRATGTAPDESEAGDGVGATLTAAEVETAGEDDVSKAAEVLARYSPLAGESAPPELAPVGAAWRVAARAFVRRLAAGRARTWRPAPRGPRFDLRRTLRTSLHTGGESLQPRWRARPLRRPRFVVFLDGSRSMGDAVRRAMQVAVAVASATSAVEVFAFSTALKRITPDVRRAAAGEPRQLPALASAWGGGTSIGSCLDEFTRRFSERLISRETIVIIVSDGLDAGEPERLRGAMARLRRQAAAVIWLNPLVRTPGFQPRARGMRVALPYITTLNWVGEASDLARLAGG